HSDFAPPPPGPGSRCCFITVASRDVSASGHLYRVTVTSGSDQPPSLTTVADVNSLLSTLSLKPYEPNPSPPAPAGEQLVGYGINLTLPAGWDGRVAPGLVEAASFHLQATTDSRGPLSLGRDDVLLRLVEHGGNDAG